MDLNELRKIYTEKTGKNPFLGWKEEELLKKLADFKAEENVPPLSENEEQAERARFENEELLAKEEPREVVFIGENPFAIVGNQYVAYADAEILWVRRDIERLERKLKFLQKQKKDTQVLHDNK